MYHCMRAIGSRGQSDGEGSSLFSNLARAGSDPPSAYRKATSVEGRTPSDALAILLILFWNVLYIPLWLLQSTSEPYTWQCICKAGIW
jgi:hypothetical protein